MARYAEFHLTRGNDVRMGPRLPQLLGDAGLEVVEKVGSYACIPGSVMAEGGPLRAAEDAMMASGFLDASEPERWEQARRRFASRPDALVWVPQFVAIGRRPG
jgi:hypothetical protein